MAEHARRRVATADRPTVAMLIAFALIGLAFLLWALFGFPTAGDEPEPWHGSETRVMLTR